MRKITNKNIIFSYFLVSLFVSCATQKQSIKDMEGVFIQKENNRIELKLGKNDFVIKDNFTPTELDIKSYLCCDTISYGSWTLDNNFLVLSTPDELNLFYLNMEVKEQVNTSSNNVTFIIHNPIENYDRKNNIEKSGIIYSIDITTINGIATEVTDVHELTIENIGNLNMLEITIMPKCSIPIRNLATREVYILPYEVQNPNANVFEINIPDLNYEYLTYKRLNNDYVKIVNRNKLVWDEQEYIRK